MNQASTTLFLPITEEIATSIIQQPEKRAEHLEQLSTTELSVLYIIQGVTSLTQNAGSTTLIERKLSEIIELALESKNKEQESNFRKLLTQRFNIDEFSAGLQLLPQLDIRLIDTKSLKSKQYLTSEGKWNFNFNNSHAKEISPYKEPVTLKNGSTIFLTPQQHRLHGTILSELDEHINIQALAGTGKTFLTNAIIETIDRFNPLILAFTINQVKQLKNRLSNKKIKTLTYKDFATWLLTRCPVNRIIQEERSSPQYKVSPERTAEILNIPSIQNLRPAQVADICLNTVKRYCNSADETATIDHLPKNTNHLSVVDQELLIYYSHILWRQTAYPSDRSFQFPLRVFHLIKKLSLETDALPNLKYTHIIVDEAQDIPIPLAQVLDRCKQPVITLGDACQNIYARKLKRTATIHQHEMTHSIRAGKQIESVINTLIDNNPLINVNRLEGSRDRDTKIIYYERSSTPDEPVTILTKSEWGMFEWFQRLAMKGAKFTILEESKLSFNNFARDCIDLFHHNKRSNHGALFRFPDWLSAKRELHEDSSFCSIDRMLSKGYTLKDLNESLAKLDQSGDAPIKIGRAFDAKNMEIETVMLAPDLLEKIDPNDKLSIAKTFSALYIGGTRARSKLIVPGHLKDWVTDLKHLTSHRNLFDEKTSP